MSDKLGKITTRTHSTEKTPYYKLDPKTGKSIVVRQCSDTLEQAPVHLHVPRYPLKLQQN